MKPRAPQGQGTNGVIWLLIILAAIFAALMFGGHGHPPAEMILLWSLGGG